MVLGFFVVHLLEIALLLSFELFNLVAVKYFKYLLETRLFLFCHLTAVLFPGVLDVFGYFSDLAETFCALLQLITKNNGVEVAVQWDHI